MKYIASCSFGKDSLASIIVRLLNGEPVDKAVYCRIMYDNKISAELPKHEEWIHSYAIPKLEKDWGVKTDIVEDVRSYKKQFYSKFTRGERQGEIYGFPQMRGAWCNSRLKVQPISRYIREQGDVEQIIGIAADEPSRIESARKKGFILPLVDHNITEVEAFEICKKLDLLSPAYADGTFRLGCWFCHNQRIGELRKLRANHPDLWEEMLQLDKDSKVTFKIHTTLHDFEQRFAEEDLQVSFDIYEQD